MDGGVLRCAIMTTTGFQPVNAIAAVIDIGQRITAVERIAANFCDAAGDGHTGQRLASIKRPITDAGHAVGDGHAGQRRAVLERIIPNAGHTVGDGHVRQAGAAVERAVTDHCHAVRNRHIGQRRASIERIHSDAGHAVGKHHTGQAGAALEGGTADISHAAGNGHTGQDGAAVECTAADAGDTALDHNRLDVLLSGGPRYEVIGTAIVRHLSRAANGQRAVKGHDPVDVLAACAPAVQVILEMDGGVLRYAGISAASRQPVNAVAAVVDIGQHAAHAERGASDAGHAAGDRHTGQPGSPECPLADPDHTIRDRHTGQACAASKRIVPDTGHAVFNDNGFHLRAKPIPRRTVAFVVLHRSLAADGQRTVTGQHPRHVIATTAAVDNAGKARLIDIVARGHQFPGVGTGIGVAAHARHQPGLDPQRYGRIDRRPFRLSGFGGKAAVGQIDRDGPGIDHRAVCGGHIHRTAALHLQRTGVYRSIRSEGAGALHRRRYVGIFHVNGAARGPYGVAPVGNAQLAVAHVDRAGVGSLDGGIRFLDGKLWDVVDIHIRAVRAAHIVDTAAVAVHLNVQRTRVHGNGGRTRAAGTALVIDGVGRAADLPGGGAALHTDGLAAAAAQGDSSLLRRDAVGRAPVLTFDEIAAPDSDVQCARAAVIQPLSGTDAVGGAVGCADGDVAGGVDQQRPIRIDAADIHVLCAAAGLEHDVQAAAILTADPNILGGGQLQAVHPACAGQIGERHGDGVRAAEPDGGGIRLNRIAVVVRQGQCVAGRRAFPCAAVGACAAGAAGGGQNLRARCRPRRIHQHQRDGAEQHRCQQDGQESFFQLDLPLSLLCHTTRFYRPIVAPFSRKTICALHSIAFFLPKIPTFFA